MARWIAPGNVAVWQRLLDAAFVQMDENDIVRDKTAVLSELKPLGPGLTGTLVIDEFRPIVMRDFAVNPIAQRQTVRGPKKMAEAAPLLYS